MLYILIIIILGSNSDEYPHVITHNDYSKQSPVDILTTNAQKIDFLPLNFIGYWDFDGSLLEISNNGHTGLQISILLYLY